VITLGIEWGFGEAELGNRIFREDYSRRGENTQVWMFLRELRLFFESRGISVVTVDQADYRSDSVPYVLYFDFSVQRLLKDRHLFRMPRGKRVLLMLEPSNVNPTLHLLPWLRKPFGKVFTFNDDQVARYGYTKISYFVLGDMTQFRRPPWPVPRFGNRKMVVGVNSNRWAYMPTSSYSLRRKYFRHFEARYPDGFDLYGHGWNRPRVFYERWFGHPVFRNYRGEVPEDIVSKIRLLSGYRFHLCIENNVNEPGYVSEKITDCFCARCVPLYLGWRGAERYVPRDTYIDLREFDSVESVCRFMDSVDEPRFERFLSAANGFMQSERAEYFTNRHAFETILSTLLPSGASRSGAWRDGRANGAA
jgi:hypothetical protein